MSRQHSPAPAHPMHTNPPYQRHAVASSSSATGVTVPANNGAPKPQQKSKGFAPGITASAEDVKYQTKYKELKRKVKEIELDNDKLYLKLLLAKKNIRRMNLERAILYERLAAVPPTPGRHPQDLPPEQDPVFAPQQPPHDHPRGLDVNDHALSEYMHAHPTARLVRGPEGNIIAIEDTPSVDSRGPVAMSGAPPPHGIPLVHNFQHESGPGYDPQRPMPALPPVAGLTPAGPVHDSYPGSAQQQQLELPLSSSRTSGGYRERGDRDWDRDRDRDRDHAPPPGSGWQGQEGASVRPPHSNNSSSSHHHRDRSSHRHSRAPSSSHTHTGNDLDPAARESELGGRLDTLPPVHRSRQPSVSESEGRGRRHDLRELSHHQQQQQHGGHAHPLAPPHIQHSPSGGPPSPPPSQSHSPNANRPLGRHNHQRVGPGAHIHRERDPEYDRELYRAREIERIEEAERARDLTIRERMAMEEEMRSGGTPQWVRDEQGLSGPGIPHGRSRSDTPNSNDASRPPSGQSYERDQRAPRGGAYGSRNLLGLDGGNGNNSNNNDYYDRDPREDRGHGGTASESRKRTRNDMEVDSDRDRVDPRYAEGASGSAAMSAARMEDIRGSKRMHHNDRERDGQLSSVRDEGPMDQED